MGQTKSVKFRKTSYFCI